MNRTIVLLAVSSVALGGLSLYLWNAARGSARAGSGTRSESAVRGGGADGDTEPESR